MRQRMSIRINLIIKIIHILKAEIRAIGTETMKKLYGKELGYLKKTKACRLKRFRALWEKNNEKYIYLHIPLQHILISDKRQERS